MKRFVFFALLLCAFNVHEAQAGIVFRDRIVPGSVCLVEFNGYEINANLIKQLEISAFHIFADTWYGIPKIVGQYMAFRITMVDGKYYETTNRIDLLRQQRESFLMQVNERCR